MRNDVLEGVEFYVTNHIKPNFSAVARQYNCDPRTVKGAYERLQNRSVPPQRQSRATLLEPFKAVIDNKLDKQCSAKSIYYFIQSKGYKGSYSTVKQYCRKNKQARTQKATIRVETNPGLSAQVDWKEEMTLHSRSGQAFTINIFLYILGYSRYKFIKLTLDRKQSTLFECLTEAFEYCQGVPQEIWFDNMATVVNREKSTFGRPIINNRFYQFSKDANFKIITCRPYRPQTKGKVEALARTMERLRVYDGEFETLDELASIVQRFGDNLNREVSQAISNRPIDLWAKEKEHLGSYKSELLKTFFKENICRIVSKESMIRFRNHQYSVSIHYISKTVDIKLSDDERYIYIYHQGNLIRTHQLSNSSFNYHKADQIAILQSDVFKHKTKEEIETFVQTDLNIFDQVGEEYGD